MKRHLDRLRQAKRLCFFGLGVQFHDCYRQLVLSVGREPDFVCDNDPQKWGRAFFGKCCLSPAELVLAGDGTAVLITVRRYEEISRQLRGLRVREIQLACFDQGYDLVHSIRSLESTAPEGDPEPLLAPVQGKWTLVTGASRGIGRQIALAMAGLGSNIIVHGRTLVHSRETLDACRSLGVAALPVAAELSDAAEVDKMLDTLEAQFPPIDIIFNNAAISLPCGADPWRISSRDYLTHYAVNTVAPVQICYRLIPPMMRRGSGRIVNVSSTIQKRAGEMAYACSKAALNKFVHDLAPTLDGSGVMISLVCPGHVCSDMGGPQAPHCVENVIPGMLLGALLDHDVNGRWFIAQDYAGLDLPAALQKATFYYSQEG